MAHWSHLPRLTERTALGVIRWVATVFVFIFGSVLLDENCRSFIEHYHLNRLWGWVPDLLPDLELLAEPHWLWLGAGLSIGIAASLWVIRLFPARTIGSGAQTPEQQRPLPMMTGPLAWGASGLGFAAGDRSGVVMVSGFYVTVTNTSSEEVALQNACIISGVTGNQIPLKVNLGDDDGVILPSETNPVPPRAQIHLILDFNERIPLAEFIRRWQTLGRVDG